MPSPRPSGSFFEENKVLFLLLFVVLLLAVISYLASEWNALNVHKRELRLVSELKNSSESLEDSALRLQTELEAINNQDYRSGLLHHLSLAFLISFITILAVEFHTRRLMRRDLDSHLEEVKQNVWEALGKRLLGPSIAGAIEAIMKEDAAKSECSYVITFKPPSEGVPSDRVIVSIENFYKVRNLAGTPGKTHRVRTSISEFEKVGPFPRFIRFDVNGEPKITNAVSVEIFQENVPLPEDTKITVATAVEAVYKLRDAESFITEIPVEDLCITISNQVPEKIKYTSVDLFDASGTLERTADASWHYGRALLPGQGFALNWRDTLDLTTASDTVSKDAAVTSTTLDHDTVSK